MWTSVIPWPWRALAVGLVLIAAGAVGWLDGASHVHKQWEAERGRQAVIVAQQAARAARIETQQVKVTQEVGNVVETRIDAVHQYYAGRVRQRPADSTGSVPVSAGSPGDPDPAPADDGSVRGVAGVLRR